ncbi:helix-turn-helix transcriptional regulator [Deinococcus antarcticus]|uniref:Helix-turn-helix transcriptional regulator n=1 Tax=Deinococcus antarcticus TaxID=1298767 RepID=A0ABV8A669_9DEIO
MSPDELQTPSLTCQVRAKREALRLKPPYLAERCGISRQALYAIEAGQYVPNTQVALKLAEALHSSVEELFTFQSPSPEVQAGGSGLLIAA